MALTPTKSIPLGFDAPDFLLEDIVSGRQLAYADIEGEKGTLVMFICNHCPYVQHVINELVRLANEYLPKGIGFVAINSNDVETYPQDSPENMKIFAETHQFPFPYLYDSTQEVAKAYAAACTPDFNLFDSNRKCLYRGRLDESRPGNDLPINGKDMRLAMDQLLAGLPVPLEQQPSIGCNIKWKT